MSEYKAIKEEYVRKTLKMDKGDEADLSSWEIEDFTKTGDNYASAVTSVKVQYATDGQSRCVTYVVKVNRDAESSMEDFKSFTKALFRKEAEFLEKITPDLNAELIANGQERLRLPKMFHYSLLENQELLFLEDLRPRGFQMFDRTKGLDMAHTILVVKEVARLHGASVLLQAKHPDEDLAEKYSSLKVHWHNHSEKAGDLYNMIFMTGLDGAAKLLNKVGGYEKAEKWLMDNKDKCFDIFKKHTLQKGPFDAILHGDCWNNNFLFRYNDDGTPLEVMLIDLQLSQKASVATELNYLLFTSLTGDVRKPNHSAILQIYYDTFADVVKAGNVELPFTSEQLSQEFKNKLEYGLINAASFSDMIVRPAEEIEDFNRPNEEEFNKMMEDMNNKALDLLDTNPLFKPRFLAVFDEMMAAGLFNE